MTLLRPPFSWFGSKGVAADPRQHLVEEGFQLGEFRNRVSLALGAPLCR